MSLLSLRHHPLPAVLRTATGGLERGAGVDEMEAEWHLALDGFLERREYHLRY